jgi:DNA-binding MarR family transcriptional regulator
MASPPATSLPLEQCIIFLIGKAFQRVSQAARARLSVHGVSPVQYVLLAALWERDGQSAAELTARVRIDSATITGVIDRLVAAGHVVRIADTRDRRVQRLRLTPMGKSLRRPLEKAMLELNREVAAELGPRARGLWATLAQLSAADQDASKRRARSC